MNCLVGQNSLIRHLGELDQMCACGIFLTDGEPEAFAAEEDARDWEAVGWIVDSARS